MRLTLSLVIELSRYVSESNYVVIVNRIIHFNYGDFNESVNCSTIKIPVTEFKSVTMARAWVGMHITSNFLRIHIAMATKIIHFRGLPILFNKCTTFYLIMTSDV